MRIGQGVKNAAYFPSRDAAIPERALLPEEGWAGRQRGRVAGSGTFGQSVDFGPVATPRAADRHETSWGAASSSCRVTKNAVSNGDGAGPPARFFLARS